MYACSVSNYILSLECAVHSWFNLDNRSRDSSAVCFSVVNMSLAFPLLGLGSVEHLCGISMILTESPVTRVLCVLVGGGGGRNAADDDVTA